MGIVKRLLVGRPLSSDRLGEQRLPKRIALPVFASDPLSSVAYATQEILLVLTVGGTAYLHLAPGVAAVVVLLLAVVVLSYRQVVRAYPSGGGSFEVASRNLGRRAGLVVAAALMVDYVMTVAVSVAAGVDNIISALPALGPYRVGLNLGFLALLTAVNLRGVRESGRAFAVPVYTFVVGVLAMVVIGLGEAALGHPPLAESARLAVRPAPGSVGLAGLALTVLLLRAFASGCTALTGVEAISNGVPAFRRPKARNAAITLGAMGGLSIAMFAGLTALALIGRVHYVDDPCRLVGAGGGCGAAGQRTVVAQLAAAVFGGSSSVPFYVLQAATSLILVLAANTAFNGFPMLAAILAEHRFLPRQLHTRGDRLAYSNGIGVLALVAAALTYIFGGSTTRLIELYILGVFTSFTLCQAGMVRHWRQTLAERPGPADRRRTHRALAVNALGCGLTGLVLAVELATKFTRGAYLVVIAMPLLYAAMRGIRRHYDGMAEELRPRDHGLPLPGRVHAVVLISQLHRPALRALAYAKATRPDTLTALTVEISEAEERALRAAWEEQDIPVPLTAMESPYRDITGSVVSYVAQLHRDRPGDLIAVYIPEYVLGRWWEQLLHNQSALRLKARLLFQRGVMVISVPWQLESTSRLLARRPLEEHHHRIARGAPDGGPGGGADSTPQ